MAVADMGGAVAGKKVDAFKQEIPGAAFSVEMVPIPADDAKKVPAFFLARTETPWDAYDAFLFNKDDESGLTPLAADRRASTWRRLWQTASPSPMSICSGCCRRRG